MKRRLSFPRARKYFRSIDPPLTREFSTPSGSSRFTALIKTNQVIIQSESKSGRSIKKASVESLIEMINAVLICNSMKSTAYSRDIKYAPYLLPIAVWILSKGGLKSLKYGSMKTFHTIASSSRPVNFNRGPGTVRAPKIQNEKLQSPNNHSAAYNYFLSASETARPKRSASIIKIDSSNEFEEVPIFFMTERKLEPAKGNKTHEMVYLPERTDTVTFGKALIHIPARNRSFGQIPIEPSWRKVLKRPNKNKYFYINELRHMSSKELTAELENGHAEEAVIVFIHGYQTSFRQALMRAAQLKYDLCLEQPMLVYSWASREKFYAYNKDKEGIEFAADNLAEGLNQLLVNVDKPVTFIAHSMGALCLAKALENIKCKINKIALVAPDIENEIFEKKLGSKFISHATGTTIYVATGDKALFASGFLNMSERVGLVRDGKDVYCFDQIDSVDATEHQSEDFFKHSYAFESRHVLTDLYHAAINGIHATKRALKPLQNSKAQTYYRIKT